MIDFKKINSNFTKLVVIFLIIIGANSLFSKLTTMTTGENRGKDEVAPSQVAPTLVESSPVAPTLVESSPVAPTLIESSPVASVFYESLEDNQNAFDLLKASAEVEYKEYDFGVFVESINGVKGNEKYFWAFYLNGDQALAGADQTVLQKGDKVEWRYEEIK